MRTKVVWSSANDSKENNVEAQQEEQNQTGTDPIQQVTERHIAQDEENEGEVKKVQNYRSIRTMLTQ